MPKTPVLNVSAAKGKKGDAPSVSNRTEGSLAYLQCDIFSITEKTTILPWKSSNQSDAV